MSTYAIIKKISMGRCCFIMGGCIIELFRQASTEYIEAIDDGGHY